MLFHVTVTHSPDDCPIYRADAREAAIQGAEKVQDLARKTGVTAHFVVTPAPAHVIYLLLEAERYEDVGHFLIALFRYPSEFTAVPVIPFKDIGAVLTGKES